MEQEENRRQLIRDPGKFATGGAVIAVVALALAFGAGRGIGLLLALPEGATLRDAAVVRADDSSPRRSHGKSSRRIAPKNSYLDPILRRNIFDSTAVGASAEPSGDPGIDGRRSSLDVTLLATVVATPEVSSSALIKSGSSRDSSVRGYGIGDVLLDDATIVRIEQKKVVIRRDDGTIEYIDMGDESSKRTTTRTSKSSSDDGEEGITKTGEFSWELDSSVVADAMGNIDTLISQVRATPHKGADGEIDGFRLSAIRRGSLLQKLGIKNGDVIHGVNGTPLSSATGAMGAFQALQSESNFSFDVTRRNKKNTFEYSIR